MKTLSDEAMAVLSSGIEVQGHHAVITAGQLDRKLYVEVNAALTAIGGTWNKKAKAHIFDGDPSDALAEILVDGGFHDKKRDLEQFFTPAALAKTVVARAMVKGHRVLEPSAGHGALAMEALRQGAVHVTCVETDPACQTILTSCAHPSLATYKMDFLSDDRWNAFKRIVMNPPFSRGKDIDHVLHARQFLGVGGRLVAIMSAGVEFRQDKKAVAFRAMIEAEGTMERLPDASFKESGTMVRTVLVTINR